ncbi:type II secretion system protein GspC [Sorangium sp. So ce367]|uniref:type II secretion system protein GspC n=1 Tax=Sorangium sp. So ce367 TaxID=3133305 RepID=UPI003F600709
MVIPELLIKRTFPVILGGMIMTAAYQQASGISYLVEEAWLSGLPPARPQPRSQPRPLLDDGDHTTSAAAILARNPFDSVTGPLTPKPASQEEDDDEASAVGGDPLLDPICEGARVLLIAASEDPSWSFATIAAGRGEPLLRREGDAVEGRSVVAIGWDRVWLAEPGARCQVRIGDNRGAPRAAPAPPPAAQRPKRGALPPEIASKIRKVSDREFVVDRTAIELVLEKQGELMRSARIVPAREGERVVGVRLARVAPDSLLTAVGLRRGDTIRSINGFDMTDPQSALQAYARLRSANNLAISLQRGGKDMTIDLRIQ